MSHTTLVQTLIGLQAFVVAFLALHDWIPLGRLNDVKAVQAADSRLRLIVVTFVSTLPFALALAWTIEHAKTPFPGWLNWYLWISYGLVLLGILPEHNGIRPNALHVLFHLVVVAICAVMIDLRFGPFT